MDWVVEYNRGAQTFRTVAYDARGKPQIPTEASYTIVDLSRHEDDADREVQASASATIDSSSTTTTATAGAGTADPTRVQCTDGSSFLAGRRYLIRGSDGQQELFLVDHKASNDLYASSELKFRYSSGASVLGVEIPWTFPAGTANDEDEITKRTPFGVDWVFTGVVPTYRRDIARIERRDVQILATEEDIRRLDQTIHVAARNRVDWANCLEQAHRECLAEMRIRGINPHDQHLGEVGREWVLWYAYWLGLRQMGSGVEGKLVDARVRHRQLRDSLIEGRAAQQTAVYSRTADTAWDSPDHYRSPFAES